MPTDEERRLTTELLNMLEVNERDRARRPDLILRWHVFHEYIRLIPDWIAEWEGAGGSGKPYVEIGARRKTPIRFVEAVDWARKHWLPKGGEDWAARENDALVRGDAVGLLLRARGVDAILAAAVKLVNTARARDKKCAAERGRGLQPRVNHRKVLNVRRTLMVHFLVYAGLTATRNDESKRQESACDAVASATNISFDALRKEWYKLKQFFPNRGDTPTLGERYPLQHVPDRREAAVTKHWHIDTDEVRRIVHHSWIQDYISRHWFVFDPRTGLPPPAV